MPTFWQFQLLRLFSQENWVQITLLYYALVINSFLKKKNVYVILENTVSKKHTNSSCCCWDFKMAQSPWKTVRLFLKNVQHRITLWPRNCTPRCIPRRNENYVPTKKNLYTNVHSSIVHNGQKWKQPTFLFTNKWITKIKNTHMMCYYSAVKRNGHMLQHGWISETSCWVWEASHKRSHIVYIFYVCSCIYAKCLE